MNSTYRIRVQPSRKYGRAGGSPPPAIAQLLKGGILREAVTDPSGSLILELVLDRPTHEEALNDILLALQQLGYSWLEGTIAEWADNAVGGAIVGALGGGAAGSKSDGVTAALSTVLGAVIGLIVGSFINNIKVVYTVHWGGTRWVLTPLAQAPSMASHAQPAM